MKVPVICLSALLGIGFSGAPAIAADPASDEQKTLYAIGVALSQSLQDFSLSEAELELVKAGLSDGVLKRPLKADMQIFTPKIEQMVKSRGAVVAEKEKKAGAAFLAKAAAEPGAKKTASGAIVKALKEGGGPSPTATDKVKVHYRGTRVDGTEFDSSVKRGQPVTFPLGNVIKCWTEGLQQMKVGGKSRLTCPPDIAYGERGSPPIIRPGATLIFDVELLEIVK
jgi:FKBP-type peptidyl-prolyl cis-trans isomerase FkpA/FKBP-type peptidyl-prolyl cis-trans isomerase FklB